MRREYIFYVYILTNPGHTTLYIGCTNNIVRRLTEHRDNRGKRKTFAGRYHCNQLVYYELFQYIDQAASREKQLKGWRREKKNKLIATMNPRWDDLSGHFFGLEY